jgi:hypothetical protein
MVYRCAPDVRQDDAAFRRLTRGLLLFGLVQ